MKKNCIQKKIKQTSLLRKEPSWLIDLRLQALAKLLESDFLLKEKMDFFDLSWNIPTFLKVDPSPRLMQVGAENVYEQLPIDLIDQGVIFTNFQEAIKKHEALIKDYWQAKSELFAKNPKMAEFVLFMNSGAFLYIPKNVEIALPVEYFWVKPQTLNLPVYSSVLLLVEEEAKVNYVEQVQSIENSEDQLVLLHLFVEVIVKKGAKVNFWANETLDQQVKVHIWRSGKLHRNSQVNWQINALSNGEVNSKLEVDLAEEGACTTVKIAGISSKKQEQKIQTRVRNYAKNSKGKIVQHGVVMDEGKLSFEGIGEIQKGAKGAISKQESRVLILSDEALGKVNPLLLIDENEVTAGHAASIGRVDENMMYYLMSRGIDKKEVIHLLIRGFLDSVMPSFSDYLSKSEWTEVIKRKLNV
ncbi:MAG: SufD family Fe-S cluster assembly protein [Streptococcaceae bacterium]|jgi:Fe-S cluster assembly protein SufD|nr:SufD family Fe-S cluster assembly protein [Streptococcaceae bacterium]